MCTSNDLIANMKPTHTNLFFKQSYAYSPSLHIDRSIDSLPYAPRNTQLALADFPVVLFLTNKVKVFEVSSKH